MINPLSSNSSDLSSTWVTENYQDFIILEAPFLQHFSVCFVATPDVYEIAIHEKASNSGYETNTMNIVYIIISILIPILLCCCFLGISCLKGSTKKQIIPEMEEKQSFVLLFDSTDQAPML